MESDTYEELIRIGMRNGLTFKEAADRIDRIDEPFFNENTIFNVLRTKDTVKMKGGTSGH